jgi:hypothetical protein
MTSVERHRGAVGLLDLWTMPSERAVGPLAAWRREPMLRMLPAEPLDGLRTAAVERRPVRQE